MVPGASAKATDDQTYTFGPGEHYMVKYTVSEGRGHVTLQYEVTMVSGEPVQVAVMRKADYDRFMAGENHTSIAGANGTADPKFTASVNLVDAGTYVMVLDNSYGNGLVTVRVVDTIMDASENRSASGAAALPAIMAAAALAARRTQGGVRHPLP